MSQQPLTSNLLAAGEQSNEAPEQIIRKKDFFQTQIFRMITLLLYMGGVSSLGLTLAFYFLVFWDSAMPELPRYKTVAAFHPV